MPGQMLTCTWAPTVFAGSQVATANRRRAFPDGRALETAVLPALARIEALGVSHLLIAQRWWGSGLEIEGSSLDCLAMTALFAAHTERIRLVTAIHPGFFQPAAIAKWGATLDWVSGGRWDINVTSGWNQREFDMYGIDFFEHQERYARSAEFIDVLRGAWGKPQFSYQGRFYQIRDLELEPRPSTPLTVFQGGQSDDAIALAAARSDWMFLNGGTLERIGGIIERVRKACQTTGRQVRFALYAAPLVRRTDAEAWDEIQARIGKIDRSLASRRRMTTGGAEGMWASDEDLSLLDTNEGYAARLIGSPDTVYQRLEAYRALGVEMLHFDAQDALFNETILPELVR